MVQKQKQPNGHEVICFASLRFFAPLRENLPRKRFYICSCLRLLDCIVYIPASLGTRRL